MEREDLGFLVLGMGSLTGFVEDLKSRMKAVHEEAVRKED